MSDFISTHMKPITKSVLGSYTLMSLSTSGSNENKKKPIIEDVFTELSKIINILNEHSIQKRTPLDFKLLNPFNSEHYEESHYLAPVLSFGNSPFMLHMQEKNTLAVALIKIGHEVTSPCQAKIKELAAELYHAECREQGDAARPFNEFVNIINDEIHDSKRRMPLKSISRTYNLIIDFKNKLICTKNAKADSILVEKLIRLLIGAAKGVITETPSTERKLEPSIKFLEQYALVVKNYATHMINEGKATSTYNLKELIDHLANLEEENMTSNGHLPLWSGRFCSETNSKDTINVGNLLHLLMKKKTNATTTSSFASFGALREFSEHLELSTSAFKFQTDLNRGPLINMLEEAIPEIAAGYGSHIPVVFETWEKAGNIAFKFVTKLEPYQEAAKQLANHVKLNQHLSLIELERTILNHAALMLEPLHQSIDIFIDLFLLYQKPIESLEGSQVDSLLKTNSSNSEASPSSSEPNSPPTESAA